MPTNVTGGPPISLDTLLLDDGIRSINFFNGRLLTGEDLTQEQAANRQGRFRLGQALGSGVAWGLEVLPPADGSTAITVKKGLAVNRQGQELWLKQDQFVLFNAAVGPGSTVSSSDCFAPCQSLPSASFTRSGLYVLALSPGQTTEERAPVSGLGNDAGLNCNFRYRVDAVQFRRASIPMDRLGLSSLGADFPLLRNRAAYAFFSNSGARQGQPDPFRAAPTSNAWTGGVDPWMLLYNDAGGGLLSDCDVPLALLYYTDNEGLRFIDMWAVRRRITSPAAQSTAWLTRHSDAALSEGEAAWQQFQDQLAKIPVSQRAGLKAADCFQYLPPAGFLPVGGAQFDWPTFLGTHAPVDVTCIDAGLLREKLIRSFAQDPFQVEAGAMAPVRVYVTVPPGQTVPFVFFARTDEARLRVFAQADRLTSEFSARATNRHNNLEIQADLVSRNGVEYLLFERLQADDYTIYLNGGREESYMTMVMTREGQTLDYQFDYNEYIARG